MLFAGHLKLILLIKYGAIIIKYVAVVPALQPSEHLNNCIYTMLQHGYDQDVYVVSHDVRCAYVTKFGANVKFVDSKSSIPETRDMNLYKAFMTFDKKYDIIILSHSDTSFINNWFVLLKELWDKVDTNKIWSITVPHPLEPKRGNKNLTLGWDPYNGDYCQRFEQCASFLYDLYEHTVTKYGFDTYFSVEYLLFNEAILARKWSMMGNNGCFTWHRGGKDSSVYDMGANFSKTYATYHMNTGYNLDHFIGIWFGRILIKHADEIIDAINDGDYNRIEYIFNEALTLLNACDCNGCGIRCRTRDKPRAVHSTY